MVSPSDSQPVIDLPSGRWPWQRSLQQRIVFTYGAAFLAVLALLMLIVGRIVYSAQFASAENHLELIAFLTANAVEEPLSSLSAEFREYTRRQQTEHSAGGDHDGDEHNGGPLPAPPLEASFLQHLQLLAERYAADTHTRISILDTRGRVLVDSRYSPTTVQNQFDQPEVQAALSGRERQSVRLDPLSGEQTLYVAAPIQEGATIHGIVQLSQPRAGVMAGIYAVLLRLTLIGALALLAATVAGYWIGRRLLRPVFAVERAAIAIGQGDFDQSVPVETTDELGALAQAFNVMTRQVRQFIEQQRLFIANASHELRTPLTNIKLRSEALLTGGKDDPTVLDRYLSEIDREADRLARLANLLLDLAQLEEGGTILAPPTAPIAVEPVVGELVESMRWRAAQADLQLKLAQAAPDARIAVRPEHLETILNNLLDNAIKYTPAGGAVNITLATQDDKCRLLIADTGPGIPPEDLPHIFERFYRVDKARSRRADLRAGSGTGAGLGLSIVKMLVEGSGGRVWAESEYGQGVTFVVEFPLASVADQARNAELLNTGERQVAAAPIQPS